MFTRKNWLFRKIASLWISQAQQNRSLFWVRGIFKEFWTCILNFINISNTKKIWDYFSSLKVKTVFSYLCLHSAWILFFLASFIIIRYVLSLISNWKCFIVKIRTRIIKFVYYLCKSGISCLFLYILSYSICFMRKSAYTMDIKSVQQEFKKNVTWFIFNSIVLS